jgi:dolichyl-phosphate beta-glucosyltransferase
VAREGLRGLRGRLLALPENAGKGRAVRTGVLAAEGRWVLVTDADLSAPLDQYARLQAAARDRDLDVVVGSRAVPGARIEVRQPRVREWLGLGFNLATRAVLRLPLRDTQCGFKLLDRSRTRPLFERLVVDGFAFDAELLFCCVRFGLRVEEVPVVWRDVPGSRVSLPGAPARMLLDLARIRWRFRRGLYNPPAGDGTRGGP